MRSVLVLCLLAPAAVADPLDDRFGASVRARIGSIRAPFYTTAHPVVRSELQAYSLIVEGWTRVRPRWSVGARAAIATSSVEEPAGSYTADYTLPLVLEATVEHVRPAWRARARAKLATLVRITDAGLPGEADPRRLGVVPSTDLALGWRARPWLSVGVGVHAVVVAIPPIEPIRDAGRSGRGQLGVTPQLEIVRGRTAFQLDLLVALAGPLDGAGLGASIAWRR